MSLTAITAQISTVLSGVSGIGNIYQYLRWTEREADFKTIAVKSGVLNVWMISRHASSDTIDDSNLSARRHTIKIHGVYALDDSAQSEVTFQGVIEGICTAFRAKSTLNGAAFNCEPAQVDLVEHRIFFKTLCHYCELTLHVDELNVWS